MLKKLFNHLWKYKFHYLNSLILVILFLLLSVFLYTVYLRFWFSLKFTFNSILYYVQKIILLDPSIPETPFNYIVNNDLTNIITANIDVFGYEFLAYFKMLINLNYLLGSLNSLSSFTMFFQIFLTLLVLIILLIYLATLLFDTQKDPTILGKRKGLIKYEKFRDKYLKLVKSKVKNYIDFNHNYKIYYFLLIFIVLFFTNIINLTLETFGYLLICFSNLIESPLILFYFLFSTITTLYPVFAFLPLFIWLIIFFILFIFLRKRRAKNKIYKLQDKNEEFCVESLGVANLTTGVMESGKDSFNTEVAITMQRVFKKKFKEIMSYYRSLFFDFDFLTYERFIDEAKEEGYFSISLQIKSFFKQLKDLYRNNNQEEIDKLLAKYHFPKEILKYKKTVFNSSEPISELDMLSEYGQSYYLYNDERPNCYSNIAMRFSYLKENNEYMSDFDFDIFKENSEEEFKKRSHYSRNWQLDTWRLGLRFNRDTGLSDCAIYNLSEGGKERGNMLTNAGKERKAQEPNQKNDDFNKFVKLLRHVYTIHYFPFVMLLMNDQRVNSINTDLNELFETIINLKKNKKVKNSLFLYMSVEKPILEVLITGLNKIIDKYRETRNYRSLFYSFVIALLNKLTLYKASCENNFNFKKVDMKISQSGEVIQSKKEFYLIFKEVYAGAYATDCYFRFFEPLIEARENRTFEIGNYDDKYASVEQFEAQNSLLVRDIEDCNAFKPILNDEEFKKRFLEAVKQAMIDYPDNKNLRQIYDELKAKYGVEFKGYKYFCKFVKTNKLLPQKEKKVAKK